MTSEEEDSRGGGTLLGKATFPADLDSLADIRRFTQSWGEVVGLTSSQVHDLQLAVNEACANAMEHPREEGDLTLWASRELDRFTIDVYHPGEFRPKDEQERRHRGLGLPLMVGLVDRVTFSRLPEGGTRVSLSVFLPRTGE
jgi:anti-sigma regulatory factor (Ser/Thr protein kinase)